MATKPRHNRRRPARLQRVRSIAKVITESWMLVLGSHTIATFAILVAERLLNLPR